LPATVSRELRVIGEIHNLEKALERGKLLMTIKNKEQAAAVYYRKIGHRSWMS